MEDSSYEALYTGVYVFIFIIALTATIFMFKTVSDIAEKSYEYGKVVSDPAIIENAPALRYRILTGNEVISYYYNYLKRDLYIDNTTEKLNYVINISIGKSNTPLKKDDAVSYHDLVKKVGLNNKYVLTYKNFTDGKNVIDIRLATEEEANMTI